MGRASSTSPLDPEQMVPDQPSGFDGPHVWLARASFFIVLQLSKPSNDLFDRNSSCDYWGRES